MRSTQAEKMSELEEELPLCLDNSSAIAWHVVFHATSSCLTLFFWACLPLSRVCRGRLEILVQNPPDGQELYWHNTRTVPKPYKGPREVRFEQDFSPDHDIKLALTR